MKSNDDMVIRFTALVGLVAFGFGASRITELASDSLSGWKLGIIDASMPAEALIASP
jgi:hypothetical protein